MSQAPTLDVLSRIIGAHSPRIVPGRDAVVHVATRTPEFAPAVSELRVSALHATGTVSMLTKGHIDTNPVPSPDGASLVFLRHGPSGADLCLVPTTGGVVSVLAEGLTALGTPAFSPDGTTVAVTVLIDEDDSEVRPPLVVPGEPFHKVDGLGWVGTARSRIRLVPLDGESATEVVSEGNLSAPAWSPDGRMLAFVRTRPGKPAHSPVIEVGIADVDRPETAPRFPWPVDGIGGPLTWEPGGESVIGIGHLGGGIGLPRLIRLDLTSPTPTVLAPDLDLGVMGGGPGYPGGAPAFGEGSRLYFCVREAGRTVLVSIDTADRDAGSENVLRHPISDTAVISALDVRGTVAVLRVSDADLPGEILAVDLGTGDQQTITSYWRDEFPDIAFIRPSPRRFAISDGLDVHGWLLRAEATRGAAPTLLDIHGGPHNAWTGAADTVHLYQQVLAEQGWNVLTLNPRASDGYGEDFLRATEGAWGLADENDFLEPLDALIAEGLADPARIAVTGYSYGGYMTCWLTANHPDRFAAAVPGGLICDLDLSAATSDMGTYLRNVEFGAENTVASSPITKVDAVRTPTLILHGQDDQRCPLDQAELWYSKVLGSGVECRLVVYPKGSHLFVLDGPVSHRRDYNQQVIDWVTGFCDRG